MNLLSKIALFVVFSNPLIAQQIKINLTFGIYINNHNEHKFTGQERNWELKNKTLMYKIDAHEKRYSDTITITDKELESIVDFIKNKGLLQSIDKEVKGKFPNKEGCSQSISGYIELNTKQHKYAIRGGGLNMDEIDEDAKKLKGIENIFYQLIENHR